MAGERSSQKGVRFKGERAKWPGLLIVGVNSKSINKCFVPLHPGMDCIFEI